MRVARPYTEEIVVLDEVAGLPAHPLIVHAPVVLIPLAALLSLLYAAVPPWRSRLEWAVVSLAVLAPIAALLATVSGASLAATYPPSAEVARHWGFGETARNLSGLFGVLALGLVGVERVRGRRGAEAPRALGVASVVLAVVVAVAAVAMTVWVVLAGHSGSSLVWGA